MAKKRRIEALNKTSKDRILVRPTTHPSNLRLPQEGTVADYLLEALGQGCKVENLEHETGWSRSTVLTNLYKVAKKSGVGIRRRSNALHLMLPDGAKHVYPRPRIVASGSTVDPGRRFKVVSPHPVS